MLSSPAATLRRTRRLTPNQMRAALCPTVLAASASWSSPPRLDFATMEHSPTEFSPITPLTQSYRSDSSLDDLDELLDEFTSDEEEVVAAAAAPLPEPPMEAPATSRTMTGRRRNFCWTLNNYTPEDMRALETIKCRAIGYGEEVSKTGTPHLQGWIAFTNGKTLMSAIKALPDACHVECMLGDCQHSVVYCSKLQCVYHTRGQVPQSRRKASQTNGKKGGEAEKRRWKDAFEAAQDGRLDEVPCDIRMRYYGTIKRIRADHLPTPDEVSELTNVWIYGPSGTGKSRHVRDTYPDLYTKLNNKWWDGYAGQETVLIDDFDKYDIALTGSLKRWCDHYPFPAELKGSVRSIRPKRIVITSNYHPRDIWDDQQSLGPIMRRFKVVHMPHPYGTVPPAAAGLLTPVTNQSPVIGATAPGFTFPQ